MVMALILVSQSGCEMSLLGVAEGILVQSQVHFIVSFAL